MGCCAEVCCFSCSAALYPRRQHQPPLVPWPDHPLGVGKLMGWMTGPGLSRWNGETYAREISTLTRNTQQHSIFNIYILRALLTNRGLSSCLPTCACRCSRDPQWPLANESRADRAKRIRRVTSSVYQSPTTVPRV